MPLQELLDGKKLRIVVVVRPEGDEGKKTYWAPLLEELVDVLLDGRGEFPIAVIRVF